MIGNGSDIIQKIDTIDGNVDIIDGYHDVPLADAIANAIIRDVLGNKSDTVAGNSAIALLKQLIANLLIVDGDTSKIDDVAVSGLLGTHDSLSYIVMELEKHFHNNEIWFGAGGVEDNLTPYTLISGNNDFGQPVQLLAPADTPFVLGNVKFDPHRVNPVDLDTASTYYIRLIWDPVSVVAGEAARQYTTFPVTPTGIGNNVAGSISDVMAKRATCGADYLWAKCKNVTNLAEIDILCGTHEYEG